MSPVPIAYDQAGVLVDELQYAVGRPVAQQDQKKAKTLAFLLAALKDVCRQWHGKMRELARCETKK